MAVGGLSGKIVRSPKTRVDEMERWVEVANIDGCNLAHVVNPGSFEDIIEFVHPELRARGLFRESVENEGAVAREVFLATKWLPQDHPGRKFRWVAGEEPPENEAALA